VAVQADVWTRCSNIGGGCGDDVILAAMQGMRGRGSVRFVRPPRSMKPLFWNVDVDAVDVDRDVDFVLTRVLERGKMVDVHWVIRRYGIDRIHRFFREAPRPELSRRTRQFWRVALRAKGEKWPEGPAFRRLSAAPWID
jgi:hypothetical protein